MKLFRFLSAVVTAAVFVSSVFGNPVNMILTYKKAVSLAKEEYGGRITVKEYIYDKENGLYSFELEDGNGLKSLMTYDPAKNTFTDGYYSDYLIYSYNSLRGEYMNRLASYGVFPAEIALSAAFGRGIIGEHAHITPERMTVLLENCDLVSFTDTVLKTADAVAADGVRIVEIYSPLYSISLTDLAFYAKREDIENRIQKNERSFPARE